MATEAAEGTVKLLWDCANELSPETHTNKLLKSYYMTNSRKIAKHQLQLPKEQFAVSQMCPRCSSVWQESEFQLKLMPQPGIAKSAKARKLIAKLEESKATHKKGLLTKTQRQRAKWLRKRVASNMQITCEFCQHKSLVPLEKPKKKKPIIQEKEQEPTVAAEPVPTPKAKRKKNKNKTAGLKIEKLTTATPAPAPKVLNKKQTQSQNVTPAAAALKAVAPKPAQTPVRTPAPKKPTPPVIATPNSAQLSQSLKAKNKNKSKAKASKTPAPVAPKIQSKTQQKNSLLQLAALLKTQAVKPSTGNPAQQRLQSLLK